MQKVILRMIEKVPDAWESKEARKGLTAAKRNDCTWKDIIESSNKISESENKCMIVWGKGSTSVLSPSFVTRVHVVGSLEIACKYRNFSFGSILVQISSTTAFTFCHRAFVGSHFHFLQDLQTLKIYHLRWIYKRMWVEEQKSWSRVIGKYCKKNNSLRWQIGRRQNINIFHLR